MMQGGGRLKPRSKNLGMPQRNFQTGPMSGFRGGGGGQNPLQQSGMQAIRQSYGGYWKPEAGGSQTLSLRDPANAQRMMEGIFQRPTTQAGGVNPSYRPSGANGYGGGFGATPMGNAQGNRLGLFDNASGAFSIQGNPDQPFQTPGAGRTRKTRTFGEVAY